MTTIAPLDHITAQAAVLRTAADRLDQLRDLFTGANDQGVPADGVDVRAASVSLTYTTGGAPGAVRLAVQLASMDDVDHMGDSFALPPATTIPVEPYGDEPAYGLYGRRAIVPDDFGVLVEFYCRDNRL